jgi:hypothetical protein
VAQSAEEAEMQARGADPMKLAQEAAAREAAAASQALFGSAGEGGMPDEKKGTDDEKA